LWIDPCGLFDEIHAGNQIKELLQNYHESKPIESLSRPTRSLKRREKEAKVPRQNTNIQDK
jgi:hypothetical protein